MDWKIFLQQTGLCSMYEYMCRYLWKAGKPGSFGHTFAYLPVQFGKRQGQVFAHWHGPTKIKELQKNNFFSHNAFCLLQDFHETVQVPRKEIQEIQYWNNFLAHLDQDTVPVLGIHDIFCTDPDSEHWNICSSFFVEIKVFLRYFFCLMTEGSGACFGSGSVLVRD